MSAPRSPAPGRPAPQHEPTPLAADLVRLAEAWSAGRTLVVLADFDGTLAPLVEHPTDASIAPSARAALTRLLALPRVAVGIVSARALDDLEERAALAGVYYAGSSGLELRRGTERVVHPAAGAARPLLARFADLAARAVAGYPGAWVERKPFGFTVHYRAVGAADRDAARTAALAALEGHDGALRVLPAPMAFEVTPALKWAKGEAVGTIVADAAGSALARGEQPLVLYAGDQASDADAFAAARALGGVTIGVGADAPENAVHRVETPSALGDVLASLASLLEERRAAPMSAPRPAS